MASPNIASAIDHVKAKFHPMIDSKLIAVINSSNEVVPHLMAAVEGLRLLARKPKRSRGGSVRGEYLGNGIEKKQFVGSSVFQLRRQQLVLSDAHSFGIILELLIGHFIDRLNCNVLGNGFPNILRVKIAREGRPKFGVLSQEDRLNWLKFYPRSFVRLETLSVIPHLFSRQMGLISSNSGIDECCSESAPCCTPYRVLYSVLAIAFGLRISFRLIVKGDDRIYGLNGGWWIPVCCLSATYGFGMLIYCAFECVDGRAESPHPQSQSEKAHTDKLYHKKYLTDYTLCNTVSDMANVLSTDKQIAVIGALAEGSSIRSIERITGVHRDTIMRLSVRVGKGCEMLLDSKMQDLDCNYLQLDEVWGFIGKKERHVSVDDNPELGDVWTFCAIDSKTKLVPSFKCGKRTLATTTEFVQDVASRMRHKVQVSSDAMHSYIEAMELAFGADVDYGQCVKVYTHDAAQHPERKYSAPHFASAYRRPISGSPEMELVSTSHVERLNATTRLHVKRLSRLTLAFSKKLENFRAAVALHFAYYNFVRRHNTLRCTPAMAAGIEKDFWSVGDLVEAVS
jgi:IS1 family transposase